MFLSLAETAREWLISARVEGIDAPAPRRRRGRGIAQDLRALVHAHRQEDFAAAERPLLICWAPVTGEHKPQRRDKRYRTQLPVRTRINGRRLSLYTDDVSFRGMFLCTDDPPPVRQLIRIETILPPNNVPFATHGMVVYVIGKDDASDRAPGVGVQFYGMGDERRAWEAFIQFIQRRSDPVPDRRGGEHGAASGSTQAVTPPPHRTSPLTPAVRVAPPANPPRATEPPPPAPSAGGHPPIPFRVALGSGAHENRRFHRFPIVLEVWPRNLDELMRMFSRDVSVGGMFLPTTRDIPLSTHLRLEIRHPHAESIFPLTAVVRRRSDQPPGVGVEFVDLDDRRRRQFFEFIHAPLPASEADELELFESD